MRTRTFLFASLGVVLAFAVAVAPGAGQGVEPITVSHTPPADSVPGRQIYLVATLTGATAATIPWRNSTMTADAVVAMTNLSQADGSGWIYAAYLPAQDSPTQVRYAINASNGEGYHAESFFLAVSIPTAGAITAAEQEEWVLTMVASLAMVSSTIAVMYWYTGRRLRRGA